MTPGSELETDPEGVAHLRRCFAGRAHAMPASNHVQAQRPRGTQLVPNPHGTAMGVTGSIGACRVFLMPGPPREMQPMFRDHVRPELEPGAGVVTRYGEVHAFGLGESAAGERLGAITARDRMPRVGLTHSGSEVTARIRAVGEPAEADRLFAETRDAILERWAPFAFGVDEETLPFAAGRLLREQGRNLTTAESCTGGWLGKMLVDVPGSSDYYVGGWVTYSNALKTSCLGVPEAMLAEHGAVSPEVAAAMAQGALRAAGTAGVNESLSITGIAGPAGGDDKKRVGTVFIGHARRVTEAGAVETTVRRFRFPGERSLVRERSVRSALQMLRFALMGVDPGMELLWERRT